MRKRKGKDVPFLEFDFALCWLDAGQFLITFKMVVQPPTCQSLLPE